MTQRERFAPDDPREWLNRARSDLAMARADVPGVYLEDLCFHAQQAVTEQDHAEAVHVFPALGSGVPRRR